MPSEMPDAKAEVSSINGKWKQCWSMSYDRFLEQRIRDIQARTLRAAAERLDTKALPGSWHAVQLRRMADELERSKA